MPPRPHTTQPLVLTGIHDGLPLGAPLVELVGVLLLHLRSLQEAGHDVVAGLVGLVGTMDGADIIPRLRGGKKAPGVRGKTGPELHSVFGLSSEFLKLLFS